MKTMLAKGKCHMSFRRTPDWAKEMQCDIRRIMSLVSVDDAELAQLATDLSTAVAAVGSALTDLEAKLAAAIAAGTPLPAGSLDGVKAALTSLQGLEVPAPTPPAA
jgi:hypothetical protein